MFMMGEQKKAFSLALLGMICISVNTYAKDAADTTFGTNGKVLELPGGYYGAQNRAVKVYADDRIVVAGRVKNTEGISLLALYRYLPDGTRDTSFGLDGASYTDHVCQDKTCGTKFITGGEDAQDMMFQSDGKIIVARTEYAGADYYNPDPYLGVVRFNTDGTVDNTFGDYYGYSMASRGVSFGWASAGAVQPDDKILVVGHGRMDGADDNSLLLSRFMADGRPDSSFGYEGTLSIDTSADSYYRDEGNDVAVQPDEKILVAGMSSVKGCGEDVNGTFYRGLLMRLNPDGTYDEDFNGGGIIKFTAASVFDVKPWDLDQTYPCEDSIFKSVAVQPDGKIVVLGTGFNSPFTMFLARFNSDGSLDTTFGYQGVRVLYNNYDYTVFDHLNTQFSSYIGGRHYVVNNMILQKDGSITVSGEAYYDGDYYHYEFLALHFTKDGNFDKRYGVNGDSSVNVDFPDDFLYGGAAAYDLAEQSTGKLILTGYADGYDTNSTAVTVRTVKQTPTSMSSVIMYLLN